MTKRSIFLGFSRLLKHVGKDTRLDISCSYKNVLSTRSDSLVLKSPTNITLSYLAQYASKAFVKIFILPWCYSAIRTINFAVYKLDPGFTQGGP